MTDLCSWKSLPGRTSNGHISITVLDRRMVTMDHPQEVGSRAGFSIDLNFQDVMTSKLKNLDVSVQNL